ncbi:hypothetical protein [Streptomyces cadmiisoli]|uniref:hypothetical protein n=1 Tax=Streptomyces cadmiisoli TaxID=2184053 RepID=UPI00365E36D1
MAGIIQRDGTLKIEPDPRTPVLLREPAEPHRDGVLTAEEFARTKAAVLRDF